MPKFGIIACPNCHSKIAVDDINKYDIDCDCGCTITYNLNRTSTAKGEIQKQLLIFSQEVAKGDQAQDISPRHYTRVGWERGLVWALALIEAEEKGELDTILNVLRCKTPDVDAKIPLITDQTIRLKRLHDEIMVYLTTGYEGSEEEKQAIRELFHAEFPELK